MAPSRREQTGGFCHSSDARPEILTPPWKTGFLRRKVATVLRPTAAFAECEDEGERLGPFGPWSTPVNLGPVVDTGYSEGWDAISKNGFSLYITSDRPGGVNGKNVTGLPEIWVPQRASLDADWGPPVNLDA